MQHVTKWLDQLGLGKYAQRFVEHEIDRDALVELTDTDLKELGLPLGPRRKLLKAIAGLAGENGTSATRRADAGAKRLGPVPGAEEGERRQLTVMFCDLVGSTPLSLRLDPEDLREIIRRYQECCTRIVKHYDGFISRYMGDGLLVHFGYPQAHEHDPERALRAGLEIVAAVKRLDLYPHLLLQTRIGVATGEVVVGDVIGEGTSEERAVVGETPNLAARLQALAEPDTVVIADSTRKLVGGLFEYADLGLHRPKGYSEPVRAWRVVAERTVDNRFQATRGASGLSPLLGRQEEMDVLRDRWRRARGGEGQVVLLAGEAGIGKSRLAQVLREELAREQRALLHFFCSPYHENSALYPVINQIERAAGFTREDPPAARLDKLESLIGRIGGSVGDTAPLLAALLSLPAADRYPPLGLSPRRQKDLTLETIRSHVESLARQRPVLMVFEDLHWIDPTTLEFVQGLVERMQHLPVLLLATQRPGAVPRAAAGPHVTVLELNRLDRDASTALVSALTGGKELPATVLEQIAAHTDGVPLFVEELTKTVLEAGFLHEEGDRYTLSGPLPPLAVPSTLQDSLMARLDRLAPIKEVAQIGAVIGREFARDLLAAVSPLDERRLDSALVQLMEAELIFQRGAPPSTTYVFKHALVQDAAYASLLRGRRQTLHAAIAQVIEDRFPESAKLEPELLAHHYAGAGLTERAITYWHRAAERAIRRSALVEALEHLNRGLELLKTLPDGEKRDRLELELQITLGPALLMARGYAAPDVEATFSRARELCERRGDAGKLFLTLRGLWAYHFVRAEHRLARELGDRLIEFAGDRRDTGYALEAHRALGMSLQSGGEFERASTHLREGFALYDREQHHAHAYRYGNDPGVVCLCYGAKTLWFLGLAGQAQQWSDNALCLAGELSHPFSRAQAMALAAMLHQNRREPALALARAEECIALSGEQGSFPYWSALAIVLRGWALGEQGSVEPGIAAIREGLSSYRTTGAAILQPYFLALLAEAHRRAGEREEALRLLAEAAATSARTGENFYDAEIRRLTGVVQLASPGAGARARGEECFHDAIAVARRQRSRACELRAAVSLAGLWREQGERTRARDLLAPVYDWFTEGFDTPDLREARALVQDLA